MLLVKARVGRSQIHGFGLIAQEFIAEGTLVWRFEPTFDVEITEQGLAALSPSAREQVLHYAEHLPAERKFQLSSDDDRFCNHADNPSVVLRGTQMYAARDISAGEEITCSYRECVVVGFSLSDQP